MTDPIRDLNPALNKIPDSVKTIHLMGVCGTAMAALAGMLKQTGFTITGSDSQVYPPMSDFLARIGVEVFEGYKPENLDHRPDLVIVGNVIPKVNPEAQGLAVREIPYISMPQALSHFYIKNRRSLVISGTHGKTTTSSMLAASLYSAGGDPTFMIGGILQQFNSNHRIGAGPYFIAEGDEYDTAFFNKVSKFLHYRPEIAVITSVEFDHADIFDSLDDIKEAFRQFVALIPEKGLLIVNGDDGNVADVVSGARCPITTYGLGDHNYYRLADIRNMDGKSRFSLSCNRTPFAEITIRLPGVHNCMNATAVIAIMHHLGFDGKVISSALENFSGVKRRQEIRGVVNSITVIDDFAHHPTAVRETLAALKKGYPELRLIAVFEPRTNTSRRAIFQEEYSRSFDSADLCLIREPVPAKIVSNHDLFSSGKLVQELNKRGKKALFFENTEAILNYLKDAARPGDLVAVLSNGGFDNIHDRLLKLLDKGTS